MIYRIKRATASLFHLPYFLKFILRLLSFYLLFRLIVWLTIGITVPGGHYSSFVDNYLNFITLIKVIVLQSASAITHLFGVSSYLIDNSNIRVDGVSTLDMAWRCCGLEILCFWTAFVIADTTKMRTKFYWLFGGLLAILVINSLRVSLLMIAMHNKWQNLLRMNHHDAFTVVAYGMVFFMMFIYYKKNKKELGI